METRLSEQRKRSKAGMSDAQTIPGAASTLRAQLCQSPTAFLSLVCEAPLYPLINAPLLAEVGLNIVILATKNS